MAHSHVKQDVPWKPGWTYESVPPPDQHKLPASKKYLENYDRIFGKKECDSEIPNSELSGVSLTKEMLEEAAKEANKEYCFVPEVPMPRAGAFLDLGAEEVD